MHIQDTGVCHPVDVPSALAVAGVAHRRGQILVLVRKEKTEEKLDLFLILLLGGCLMVMLCMS